MNQGMGFRPATLDDLYWAATGGKVSGAAGFGGGAGGARRVVSFVFDGIDRLTPRIDRITGAFANMIRTMNNFNGDAFVEADGRLSQLGFSTLFLGLNLQNLGRSLQRVGAIGIAAFGGLAKAFLDADLQMRRVNTQVQLSGGNLQAFNKEILNISTRVPQGIKGVTDALYELFSGIPALVQQPGLALRSAEVLAQAAAAGFTDMAETARFAVLAVNSFNVDNLNKTLDITFTLVQRGVGSFSELISSFSQLAPYAALTNQRFESMAAAMAILSRETSSATLSSVSLRNTLQLLTRPDIQKKIKDTFHFDVTEIRNGQLQFKQLQDVLARIGENPLFSRAGPAGQTAIINRVFGSRNDIVNQRALAALVTLTRQAAEYRQEVEKFNKTQGAMNRALVAARGPTYAWQIALNTVKAAFIDLGASGGGILTSMAGLVRTIALIFLGLPDPVQKFLVFGIGGFGALAISMGFVLALLGQILTGFVALQSLVSAGVISAVFRNLGVSVLRAAGAFGFLAAGIFLVIRYHEQLAAWISGLWDSWYGKIIVVVGGIILLMTAFRALQSMFAPLMILIQLVFNKVLASAIVSAARLILTFIGQALFNLATMVVAIGAQIATSLSAVTTFSFTAATIGSGGAFAIGAAFVAVVAIIILAVTGGFQKIGSFIGRVVGGIVNFIQGAAEAAHNWTSSMVKSTQQSKQTFDMGRKGAEGMSNAVNHLNKDTLNLADNTKKSETAAKRRKNALTGEQIDVQRAANRLSAELQRQQDILQDYQDELKGLQDQYNKAKDALNDFANARLPGMHAADDAIFSQEQKVKTLELALSKAGEAGTKGFKDMEEALASFNSLIDQFNLDKILDRDKINSLRAMFTGSVAGAGASATSLSDELDKAQNKLKQLQLQRDLTFDPLQKKLKDAADMSKEMTFQEAMRGIINSRREMERLQPAIDRATAKVDRQEKVVARLEKAYRGVKAEARDLGLDARDLGLGINNAALADQAAKIPEIDLGPLSDPSELESNARRIAALPNTFATLPTDMADNLDFTDALKNIDEFTGKIDNFLNNANGSWDRFQARMQGVRTNLAQIWGFITGDMETGIGPDSDAREIMTAFGSAFVGSLTTPIRIVAGIFKAWFGKGGAFGQIMDGFAQYFRGWANIIGGILKIFTGNFRKGFSQLWNGIRGTWAGALNILVGTIRGGLNGAINTVNAFINFFNRLLPKSLDIPKIPNIPAPGGGSKIPNNAGPGFIPSGVRGRITHSGGMAGAQALTYRSHLKPDERLHILQTGERVLSRDENDTYEGRNRSRSGYVWSSDLGGSGLTRLGFGGVKPWVAYAGNLIRSLFGNMSIGGVGSRPNRSDHPGGLALDFMVGRNVTLGNRIASYLQSHAQQLKVKYLIWQQRINSGGGWSRMADRGSPTANHMDHVHASFVAGGLGRLLGGGIPGLADIAGPLWAALKGGPKFGGLPDMGMLNPYIDNLRKSAYARIKNMASGLIDQAVGLAGGGFGTAGVGGNAALATGWATKGLRAAGLPLSWLPGMLKRAFQESRFNPRAINLTDINARRGTPSKGIMQMIDPTFRSYMVAGMGDIWNPVDNFAAAGRYIKARYGSPYRLPSGGYKDGAWEILEDQIAGVHKGEMVVPEVPAEALRRSARNGGGSGIVVVEKTVHIDTVNLPNVTDGKGFTDWLSDFDGSEESVR